MIVFFSFPSPLEAIFLIVYNYSSSLYIGQHAPVNFLSIFKTCHENVANKKYNFILQTVEPSDPPSLELNFFDVKINILETSVLIVGSDIWSKIALRFFFSRHYVGK